MEQNKSNPLKNAWNIISLISGAIGLVSLTDNLLAWKGFLPEVITSYKEVVNIPFKLLSIEVKQIIIDYFFIGLLFGISFSKAIKYGAENKLLNTYGNLFFIQFSYILMYFFFWPLGVIISIFQVLFLKNNERLIKIHFLQWVGGLTLVFLFTLIINTLINK